MKTGCLHEDTLGHPLLYYTPVRTQTFPYAWKFLNTPDLQNNDFDMEKTIKKKLCLFYKLMHGKSMYGPHFEGKAAATTSTPLYPLRTLVSQTLHPRALASQNWEYKALVGEGSHLPILANDVSC